MAQVDVDQNKDAPMAERRVSSLGTWAGFDLEVTPCVDPPKGGRGGGLEPSPGFLCQWYQPFHLHSFQLTGCPSVAKFSPD